jgi:hypothetical protein
MPCWFSQIGHAFPAEENEMPEAADIVDAQIKAFQGRDLEGFLACYSANAVVKDADGNVMMSGLDSLRRMYAQLFRDSPRLAVQIPNRMAVSEYVIDEERIEGFNLAGYPPAIHAVAVYRITDETIHEVTLLT